MLNLSLNELKIIAKSRGINRYKSQSKEKLLSALNELQVVNHCQKYNHEYGAIYENIN